MPDGQPTQMQFGCQIATYGDVKQSITNAARAETAGFDVITVPDHLFHPTGSEEFLTEPAWEAFATLGAIAQHTDEAMLMPGVTDSVRRHPTELAHVGATLDRMTDGRFGLGIGAGEAFNFAPIKDIDWDDPFGRFSEAFKVIDGLWESTVDEPLDYHGDYFELDGAQLGLKPVQDPRPPMWVGGYGPSMRGFTGALADGWFPWIHAPDQYAEDLERVLDVAEDRGRDPSDIDRAVMVPTAVAQDGDAARQSAIERNRTSLALRPPLLAKMGYEDIAEQTPIMFEMAFDDEQERQLIEAAKLIPDEVVDEIMVAGTPEDVIEDVETWQEAGLNNLVLIPVGDFAETMTHYEETIIPYFQE